MLIRLLPLPDELDEGYAGYVMRLNGKQSMKDLDTLMREWAGCPDASWRDVSRLELLSKVANLTVMDFVLRHTTLPLRRGITSNQADLPHGSDQNKRIWWSSAMRESRTGAYFCEYCACEDVGFHGRSYWRRSHQIPGMLSCPKHDIQLNFCRDNSAFHRAPSYWIGNSESVNAAWARELMGNDTINRYLAICDGLMDCRRPFAVKHVRAVLCQRGASLGLRISANKVNEPLLSDRLAEECGRQWLALVLPALAEKPEKVPLPKIDGVFYLTNSASTSFAYILACASLYDSADDALNALAGPVPEKEKTSVRKRIDIEPDMLVSAYISVGGSYAKTAKELGIAFATAANRLSALGYPNMLDTADRSTQKALSAFFNEGSSLQRSAEVGGVSPIALEEALRIMGAGAFKAISKSETGKRKGSRRSYPLLPDKVKNSRVASDLTVDQMADETGSGFEWPFDSLPA